MEEPRWKTGLAITPPTWEDREREREREREEGQLERGKTVGLQFGRPRLQVRRQSQLSSFPFPFLFFVGSLRPACYVVP